MLTEPDHARFRTRLGAYLRRHFPPAGRMLSLEQWQRHRLTESPALTAADMRETVAAALAVLQGLYVHMELKRARRGVDPVSQLRVLSDRIETMERLDAHGFHERMLEIFKLLGDVHTAYRRPEPYKSAIAFLPFLMNTYFDDEDRREFVVTRTLWQAGELACDPFGAGAEVVTWNGAPMTEAVRRSSEFEEGSNAPHDFALALQFMTVRWLGASFEPDAPWVDVGYRVPGEQTVRDCRFFWSVFVQAGGPRLIVADQARSLIFDVSNAASRRERSLHIGSQVIHAWRKKLFVPEPDEAARTAERMIEAGRQLVTMFGGYTGDAELQAFNARHADLLRPTDASHVPTLLPLFFDARIHGGDELLERAGPGRVPRADRERLRTKSFGYLGIRAFAMQDPERTVFRYELRRLLHLLPQDGLIIDIRDNPGGSARNAEESLQFLTPNQITPLPFRFVASALTRDVAREGVGFADYAPSIQMALATGASFSAGRPITSPAQANVAGQHYFGPVLLITSGTTYSAADIFAAGFQDNGVGPVMGVDDTTGGGGANCWFYREEISRIVKVPPLPAGINMQIAVRQCARVGEQNAGVPIEEIGIPVPAASQYRLRRQDVVEPRPWGLLLRAASVLAARRAYRLTTSLRRREDGTLELVAQGAGMHRLDAYVDGRPTTLDFGTAPVSVPVSGTGRVKVELHGFAVIDDEETRVARAVHIFNVEEELAQRPAPRPAPRKPRR